MNIMEQQVLFTNDICEALKTFTSKILHDRLFILFDTETLHYCLPVITPFMNEYDMAHPNQKIETIIRDRLMVPGTDLIFPQYSFSRPSKKRPEPVFAGFKEMVDANDVDVRVEAA